MGLSRILSLFANLRESAEEDTLGQTVHVREHRPGLSIDGTGLAVKGKESVCAVPALVSASGPLCLMRRH